MTRPSTPLVIPGREQLCERTRNPSWQKDWILGLRQGAHPGMTRCERASVRWVSSDSNFKQPRVIALAYRASCGFSLAPKFTRGMERREAQMCCFASGIACEAMLSRKRVASRRSICGDFGRGDRTSGSGRVPSDPLSNWLSPAFILSASSRERQSHVVGPDGDPSLPDVWLRTTSRRRRILLRIQDASRSAPHEQDDTDYIPR
jgi:hypothetical protein